MAAKFSFSKFFGMDDEDYENNENYEEDAFGRNSDSPVRNKSNVVPINSPKAGSSKIALFEPRIYSDVKEIANQILQNEAAIVNFSRVEEDQAKRIVDFLTGTVFAINGDIERIGDQIFLCTPHNFEISGNLSANLDNQFN